MDHNYRYIEMILQSNSNETPSCRGWQYTSQLLARRSNNPVGLLIIGSINWEHLEDHLIVEFNLTELIFFAMDIVLPGSHGLYQRTRWRQQGRYPR